MRDSVWRAGVVLVACFYPVYLVASAIRAGIVAAVGLAFDHGVEAWQVSALGVSVRMAPNDLLQVREVPGELTGWISVGVALGCALLPGGLRPFGCLLAAVMAYGQLSFPVMFRIYRGPAPGVEEWPLLLAGAVVLVFALRGVAASSGTSGYWRRVAFLMAVYVAPLAVLPAVAGGRRSSQMVAAALVIGVAAALLGARPARALEWRPAWAAGLAGAVLSAALFAGVDPLDARLRQGREETVAALARSVPVVEGEYERVFFQRGVSFTAEGGGGYSSETAREMLRLLPRFGVDAIALIPYGRRESEMAGMVALAGLAREVGIRVMVKPHTRKPAKESLPAEADRARWFAGHAEYVEHWARFASEIQADLFCVGVEFGWLARYDAEWREVIRRVRSVYDGPLVYAANHGDEFESVTFWDALDYIGLDNYYPLDDDLATGELVERVRMVHERYGKPVIFTEAGYSATPDAHRTPWHDAHREEVDLQEQARCYEALLEAFYEQPWFYGVYWWKVGTNGFGGPENSSMTPWRKPAMDVLARWYGGDIRREPMPPTGTSPR